MLVRLEHVRRSIYYSVICEADRFFGDITQEDFEKCTLHSDTIEIDGYEYWTVDKNLILKYSI